MDQTPLSKSPEPAAAATPWFTAAIALAAIVITAWPAAATALVFERDRVIAGELWRLWSAHLAHFGWSHLGWNLLIFALAGGWVERISPRRTRLLYVICPPLIGLALLALDPELQSYGGLSGLAAATLTLLALTQLARPAATDRWFWRATLMLLGLKIGFELLTRRPTFAHFAGGEIRTVPIAHVAGALVASLLFFRSRRGSRGAAAS